LEAAKKEREGHQEGGFKRDRVKRYPARTDQKEWGPEVMAGCDGIEGNPYCQKGEKRRKGKKRGGREGRGKKGR